MNGYGIPVHLSACMCVSDVFIATNINQWRFEYQTGIYLDYNFRLGFHCWALTITKQKKKRKENK